MSTCQVAGELPDCGHLLLFDGDSDTSCNEVQFHEYNMGMSESTGGNVSV